MSLRDCIDAAVAGGEMDPERARRARELFDGLEERYRGAGRMGPDEAARRAQEDTLAAVRRETAEKKRRTLLQIRAQQQLNLQLRSYRTARGQEDWGAALLSVLDHDDRAPWSNVEGLRKAIRGRLHARMLEVLDTHRRDLLGRTRNKAQLDNLVREAFGEETGDAAARELAEAWKEAAEFARRRFNAAGGHIGKRDDWGMPQHHDPLAIRKVSYQEWRDFIAPRLDPTRMVDERTGLPMTREGLEVALRQVYDTTRTDGFAKLKPQARRQGRALANRRADSRFLVFRDAGAWLEYNGRFGGGDPFSTMLAHLDGMARDIARMEILGPNDAGTMELLAQMVEKRAVERDVAEGGTAYHDRAGGQIKLAQDMYAHITGAATQPINGRIARSFAGLRSVLASAQLGAATLSAVTDVNYSRIANKMTGIPQFRTLERLVKLFDKTDRQTAVRLGLIAENAASVAMAQARYVGAEVQAPEIAARISGAVLRLSGLSPWTQAGRWAFGMEFAGLLAQERAKAFSGLPSALQETLRRYGFGAEDWDIIRATEPYTVDGEAFLRADDIAAREDLAAGRGDALADRVLEMIQSETEFAVPSASLRGRAWLISDLQPGNLQGELLRSVAMYKNFSVTLAMTHIRRGIMAKGLMGKGQYFANLVITASLLGALSLQLKEISKGRDPRPMTSPEFWAAAMLQGGGLGIFGDFLFTDLNRFDRSLGETVAGPVVGFANDVRRLTLGNLMQLPGEQPTNFGNELVGFLKRYTPAGSLWYTRLALERLVFDELQGFVDPQAERRQRGLIRKYQRQLGQRYWWRPGETAPQRPPDLSNAMEAAP